MLGAAAVLLLLPAILAGWPSAFAWVLALLGAEYAASVAIGPGDAIDGAAPLYATGLLVLAELAYWSVDLRMTRREELVVHLRRLATIAVLALVSLVLGSLLVLATAVPTGGGLAWDAVGVAAAVGTLALVALLARRAARG
jgi:hypothetical protein